MSYFDKKIDPKSFFTDPFKNREPMPDMPCGDLTITDSGDLGLEVYDTDDKTRLIFLTQGGELGLLDWLNKKYPQGRNSKNVLLGHRPRK